MGEQELDQFVYDLEPFWSRHIQSVIDGKASLTKFQYDDWHKNDALNVGMQLRPDAIPCRVYKSSIPLYIRHDGVTVTTPVYIKYYDPTQFEPVQGITAKKFALFRMMTIGNAKKYAIRKRNMTDTRPDGQDSDYWFLWIKNKPTFKEFVPHFNANKNVKDRYLNPWQEETLMLTIDLDCHDSSPYTRNHYAYNVLTLCESLASKLDIFDGLDYRVVINSRQARPGTHINILFKPDLSVNAEVASKQLRTFMTNQGLNPAIEIYPSDTGGEHLILAPLSPSHVLLADKPYTEQKDKIEALFSLWWEWDSNDYKPMSYSDIKKYLQHHCHLPQLPKDFQPEKFAEKRRRNKESEKLTATKQPPKPIEVGDPTDDLFILNLTFPIFQSGEWNPGIHQQYQRDPSELFEGDGRNIYMMSIGGYILRQLQRVYGGYCPWHTFLHNCALANDRLAEPLDEAELLPRLKRIFYKYRNTDDNQSPPSEDDAPSPHTGSLKRNRTCPSDKAITGGDKYERNATYNGTRADITQAFYDICVPSIHQGNYCQYIVLEEVADRIVDYLLKNDTSGKYAHIHRKSLHHMVSDLIRNHLQSVEGEKIKGVKRTINRKKQTVYYGFQWTDHPRHVFNSATFRAVFKYNGKTYRFSANSPEHAEELFYEAVHNASIQKIANQNEILSNKPSSKIGSPTCPLRCVRGSP